MQRSLWGVAAALVIAAPALAAEPVTIDNFKRAETDHYFAKAAGAGCLGKFCHDRVATPVTKQPVIRMNRDTIYSNAVVDLSSPVTIAKPDTGKRFQSMLVINQDHYIPLIAYAPGRYTLTKEMVGTRYAMVMFRTFMDPNDAKDVAAAHAAQDSIKLEQADPGKFEIPDWDEAQRQKLSTGIVASLGPFTPDSTGMFGAADKVDPVRHLVGTAAGWGGNPVEDAKYLNFKVAQNDGITPHVLTVKDVPVDGFWSVIVYNAKGYFEAPETAVSVNNVTGKRNKDGSMTIHFGGDPKAPNYLRIMPGWNYMARLYRPRAEVAAGKWTFPEAVPVR
jgi:hypothetical protein